MKKNIALVLVVLLIIVTALFPVYAVNDDSVEIIIDGEFYDWEDKMDFHVPVYKDNAHADEISQVCLFRDEENVYVHVIFPMSISHNINSIQAYLETNLGNERYKLKLGQNVSNGQEPFFIEDFELHEEEAPGEPQPEEIPSEPQPEEIPGEPQPEEAPGEPLESEEDSMITDGGSTEEEIIQYLFSGIDLDTVMLVSDQEEEEDLTMNVLDKPSGDFGKWEVAVYLKSSLAGMGYYVKKQGASDELEFSIPLSSVSPDYDGITEIEMRIPKLGDQTIICTGISTGAFAGIAAGAGIAILSAGAYGLQRRNKR